MAIEQNQNYLHTGQVEFQGGVKIVNGAEGVGKVLTSDASGNATWTSSSAGVLQSATVTITSAQLLAIKTTPITLVAAQGANTIIIPIRITSYMDFATTPYVGDTILRTTLDPSFITTNFGNTTIIALSADGIISLTASTLSLSSGGGLAYITNTPLVMTTSSSNPTGGDSDIKVTVLYSVITI